MNAYHNNKQSVPPYSKLAYIYDDVMDYVNYKRWARYIQKSIDRFRPETRTILDISCGTGSLLLKLDSKRYQLLGFDFSYDMIRMAHEKSNALRIPIYLWQSNMTLFKLKKPVDTIICLYDSINYLLKLALWKKLFDCVYEGLNNNGLFIFDICTERNSREFFNNYFEKRRGKGYCYSRQSHYDICNRIHDNRFVIHFDSEKNTFIERHQQLILLQKEVLDLIATTDFQLLGAYDGFTFTRGTERSLRIHFVLKKNIKNDSSV